MPIVTIYQGVFTAGEEIANGVARSLGYRCVSREVLIEASRGYGITEAKLNEILEKDSHWWERWLQNTRPYRVALETAMCEVAQRGNVVYHGHIGHELLPGIRHVLKVLLMAPLEFPNRFSPTRA
jgi:Cytidylate kinase-like family